MAGTSSITQVKPSYVCQSVYSTGVGESRLNALDSIEVDAISEGSIAEIGPTQDLYRWAPSSVAAPTPPGPSPSVVIPRGQPLATPGRWILVSSSSPASVFYQFIEAEPLATTLLPEHDPVVAAIQQSTLFIENGDIIDVGVPPLGYTKLTLNNQQIWYTDVLGSTVAMNRRARIRFVSHPAAAATPVIVTDEPATDTTVVTLYSALAAAAPLSGVLLVGNTTEGTALIVNNGGHLQLVSGTMEDVLAGASVALGAGTGPAHTGGQISMANGAWVNMASGSDIALASGSSISVAAGGQIDLLVGTGTAHTGGKLDLASGSWVSVGSGGDISVSSGGTVSLSSGASENVAAGGAISLLVGTGTAHTGGQLSMANQSWISMASGSDIAMASGSTISMASGSTQNVEAGGTISLNSNAGTPTTGGKLLVNSDGWIDLRSGAVIECRSGSAIDLFSGSYIGGVAGSIIYVGGASTLTGDGTYGAFTGLPNGSATGGGGVVTVNGPSKGANIAGDAFLQGGSNTPGYTGGSFSAYGAQASTGGGVDIRPGVGDGTHVSGNLNLYLAGNGIPGEFIATAADNSNTAIHGSFSFTAARNMNSGIQQGASLYLGAGFASPAARGGSVNLSAGSGGGTGTGGTLNLVGGSSGSGGDASQFIIRGASTTLPGHIEATGPVGMISLASDPANNTSGSGQLYAKTLSGATQLFWRTQAGTVYQLTPPGTGGSIPWISMPDANTVKPVAGFPNTTDSSTNVSAISRLFAIAPSAGSYYVYSYTNKYVKSGIDSVNWTDVEGQHWFYFDAAGVLQHTVDPSAYLSGGAALIAQIYWDATNKAIIHQGEERHSYMDVYTHTWAHTTIGALWVSGGDLANFTIGTGALNSHAQFSCNTTVFRDEDLKFTITNGAPQTLSPILSAPVFYLTSTGVWRRKTADNYPVIQSGSAGYVGPNGRLAYNLFSGGVWTLSEVPNNDYVLSHVFATNDVNNPIVVIVGQAYYATLSDAQAGAQNELQNLVNVTTLFTAEATPLASVIYQTASSYGNAVKGRIVQNAAGSNYWDWRGNRFKGGAGSANQSLPVGTAGQVVQNNGTYWQSQSTLYTASGWGTAATDGWLRGGPSESIVSAKYAAYANSTSVLKSYVPVVGQSGLIIGDYQYLDQMIYDVNATGAFSWRVNGAPKFGLDANGPDCKSQRLQNVGTPTTGTDGARWQDLWAPHANITIANGATIDDYAPTDWTTLTLVTFQWSDATSKTITGFSASGLITNLKYVGSVGNAGTQNLILAHNNAGSAAANRIYCPGGTDITIPPADNKFVLLGYDTSVSRWRVLSKNF